MLSEPDSSPLEYSRVSEHVLNEADGSDLWGFPTLLISDGFGEVGSHRVVIVGEVF